MPFCGHTGGSAAHRHPADLRAPGPVPTAMLMSTSNHDANHDVYSAPGKWSIHFYQSRMPGKVLKYSVKYRRPLANNFYSYVHRCTLSRPIT